MGSSMRDGTLSLKDGSTVSCLIEVAPCLLVSNIAGLFGSTIPLTIGLAAQHLGLDIAIWLRSRAAGWPAKTGGLEEKRSGAAVNLPFYPSMESCSASTCRACEISVPICLTREAMSSNLRSSRRRVTKQIGSISP